MNKAFLIIFLSEACKRRCCKTLKNHQICQKFGKNEKNFVQLALNQYFRHPIHHYWIQTLFGLSNSFYLALCESERRFLDWSQGLHEYLMICIRNRVRPINRYCRLIGISRLIGSANLRNLDIGSVSDRPIIRPYIGQSVSILKSAKILCFSPIQRQIKSKIFFK